jgi:hypothetical protein
MEKCTAIVEKTAWMLCDSINEIKWKSNKNIVFF